MASVFRQQMCAQLVHYSKLKEFFHIRTYASVARPARKKTKSEKRLAKAFVDYQRVRVVGGSGGKGAMSFLSLPRREFAGPDGGDGGNGGHVLFEADQHTRSLANVKSLYHGIDGTKGRGDCCFGKNGDHIVIKVPVGTMFADDDRNSLVDLTAEGEVFIGARGGAGGKGNHFFLSNENRAPTVYEEGGRGEEKVLHLEMRILAHAALVGFPNVGKSTLLSAISRAQPKIAAYPFTTLRPHVGMIEYPDFVQVAVADIPGLIEGAHLNYGLGFAFLRHIRRCSFLLYVVDVSLPEPGRQLDALKFELEQYQEGLSLRPHAVIANKIDVPQSKQHLEELRKHCDLEVIPVSAMNRMNIKPLLQHLRELYDKHDEGLEIK